jgi:hypothetical protein
MKITSSCFNKIIQEENLSKFSISCIFAFIGGVFLFMFLPFIVFGENSIITIFDNLNNTIPEFKMFHDGDFFFKFDVPTNAFDGRSTLYYSYIQYDFFSILFYLFNTFTAYVLNYYFAIIFGFISMFILLKYIKCSTTVSIFVAICYAILPTIPYWHIAMNTIPLAIVSFLFLQSRKNFSWVSIVLVFYPFISSFGAPGIFILGLWVFTTLFLFFKKRFFNINLTIGFFALCFGYILVNLKMFYVQFILQTPLNRQIYYKSLPSLDESVKYLLSCFKVYLIDGYFWHVASTHIQLIIPLCFIILFFYFLKVNILKNKIALMKQHVKYDTKIKIIFSLLITFVIFCFLSGLFDSGLINSFIYKILPVLTGFNFARIRVFNRQLCYIIFALCLDIIFLKSKNLRFSLTVHINHIKKYFDFSKIFKYASFFIVFILTLLQAKNIIMQKQPYNNASSTWAHFKHLVQNTDDKNWSYGFGTPYISYKNFFSESLFEKIKKDISYSNEPVAALGFYPSVLMYNGFNCIDGFDGSYPLAYMLKFRSLIAPELEINKKARLLYDESGSLNFLFNSELSFEPTWNKAADPVNLNLDMDIFRNDFNGTYILSRAEIANVANLNLRLIKIYKDTFYDIYLYTAVK